MFETQKYGNKPYSGEIGLNIRTHPSPKLGKDKVSRGEASSVCMRRLLQMFYGNIAQLSKIVKLGNKVQLSNRVKNSYKI